MLFICLKNTEVRINENLHGKSKKMAQAVYADNV